MVYEAKGRGRGTGEIEQVSNILTLYTHLSKMNSLSFYTDKYILLFVAHVGSSTTTVSPAINDEGPSNEQENKKGNI